MRFKSTEILLAGCIAASASVAAPTAPNHNLKNTAQAGFIEEVIITAQRREQSLQDIPIAISVLDQQQLKNLGVSSLGDLMSGTVPSLHMQPYANTPSTLVVAIRGNGPGDVGQTTRDSSVAIYLDEVYLGRSQSLDFELAETQRIEVLRGPQGTLYGRNATGGAINLISQQPTGELGLRQTVSAGNYNLLSSVTHLDLPSVANISTKIDLLYAERDGWVDNTAAGQSDYNEFEKQGFKFSAAWSPSDTLGIDYSYHHSDTEMSQNYYQFHRDFIGVFGDEGGRKTKTRLPLEPLEPSSAEQDIHSVHLDWQINQDVYFTSITAYREMENEDQTNFGGTLYFNGFNDRVDVDQEQFSQEFRLVGSIQRLDWISGLYYQTEDVTERIEQLFTLDIFGLINPEPLTPIIPPTNFDVFSGAPIEPREVSSELESLSWYGQATYTPPVLNDQFRITLGLRYTNEEKNGQQTEGGNSDYTLEDDRVDPAFTLEYLPTDNINLYAKWSRAFRSGGVNVRSPNLIPYDLEEVDTSELGLKLTAWDQRLRLNAAAFFTDYDGMFIDVFDPDDLAFSDTVNASEKVEVDGFELELTVIPIQSLTTALAYTYLDGEMPLQPNPLSTDGQLEQFNLTQTPKHAGSLIVNYAFQPTGIGIFSANMEVISRSQSHHFPTGGKARPDGYTLFNARIALSAIPITRNSDELEIAVWGKNLNDEEYVVSSFHFAGASTIQAFGEPRTYGVDIQYSF